MDTVLSGDNSELNTLTELSTRLTATNEPIDLARNLLLVKGRFLGRPASILFDNASLENLVSSNFIRYCKTRTSPFGPFESSSAYGKWVTLSRQVPYAKLTLPGHHTERISLAVAPTEYDVILGKPWLTSHKAIIDCTTNTVTFDSAGDPIRIAATAAFNPSIPLINAIQVKREI